MRDHQISRRTMLQLAGAAALPLAAGLPIHSARAAASTLTIAYNVNLPSFDPTVGVSAVNPTIQSIYQAIFDPYIGQAADLSFKPGLLTKWGWNEDRSKVTMELRSDATWHDGSKVTPEDVVWSLTRAADPKGGNPIQFVWSKINNFKIDGQTITADVVEFEPVLFKWMAFLTGYVLPKAYYEKVGAEGFEKAPIGSGPYKVDAFERNAFLRLKAHPGYWGPKPAFDTVVFKFVTDPTSRVAEIESGGSDITFEIPYEEFDRLKAKPNLAGLTQPISDIGMIFLTDIDPMLDRNVRLAANHAIDKKAIVEKLLRGYGVPIDTLEAPGYAAFDPSIKTACDPELAKSLLAKSGYSTAKPVKFTIQTTRGFKPKDYEMVQAIAGMWRKVGIEANIEVYEIAQHFELRARHALAPAAFYNWGNAIGDPTTSTGFAMFGPSPHSAWKGKDLIERIGPLWGEKDDAKRIAGWKAVDKYIAEEGEVIPLLQYVQPIIHKKGLKVVPQANGMILPQLVTQG
ncbi:MULTISPECIES: ABC transporter substrate-binding protein [Bradyrhizobium]|uniref:Peptide ABC transporter substrate-binding protein n=4 Tax=Bradyrhizobium TaxID=374 RepID=A0ABS5G9B1_9BRAD|nr:MULTISPECIES: ABC transporter substrate-binding protein [Bradyrhizobium]MBR1137740.1 peptide ABC transporter substrate-binding protein [Bradyrhizobium denitrificans]MDU1495132.1 ABC transporter substrate-binding protein [Bradyrhizobium sp.]MDU1545266.1 ABC transporter substrate-binding protein [Bradyrhizobium sp.]MDU1666569.1 ABC transporter substrate-binding protein [Bradyrhizobium sp.]MDU1692824.1 ABC transporter substrate-binding protein [Bradyrhizobium sp.]